VTGLWTRPRARPPEPVPGETIPELFWNAVRQRGERVALRQKDFGIWQATSWRELGRIAHEIAMGLAALGFEPGDCASILSNTRREWMFADLGILSAGGVSNGIYPTDAAGQCEYLLNDSSRSMCSSRTRSSSTRCWRCARVRRSCGASSCSTWKAWRASRMRR
jgi:long-chain acyl-CoA synthetase